MKKLNEIQQKLKAPKGQFNSFGEYAYRSCEDILEAIKPLLGEATLTISDDIVLIGNRYYVKATVTLKDDKEEVSNTAFAREEEDKKGMAGSQITGAASSYARKYALNGLFCIDDTKDADTMDNSKKEKKTPVENFGNCDQCHAPKVKSKATGKVYCSRKCWLEPAPYQKKGQDENDKAFIESLPDYIPVIEPKKS